MTLGDQSKPAFDLIDPGGVGRREVDMEALATGEPGADLGMLVSRVIIDDEVDVEVSWNIGVDVLEEAQKLLMAMAWLAR